MIDRCVCDKFAYKRFSFYVYESIFTIKDFYIVCIQNIQQGKSAFYNRKFLEIFFLFVLGPSF